MTAFEIYINGRKKCTVGIKEAGVVALNVTWVRGTGKKKVAEDPHFRVSGLISRTHTHVDWLQQQLKTGDEVKIVVVEKAKVDRPNKRRTESKVIREKREREYIEMKAAKFGWKITK
jgi:hypothetical protein